MENGNTSANSAYQTWRQFSGNPLKKKDSTTKANLLYLDTNFITPAQKDWTKDLMTIGKNLIQTKAQLDEDADKQAKAIFGSRSLDQFTKEYREGNLPSQNNPLVMSRMKKMYGQTLAGLAHTDFLNRISSNEFYNMSPQEVDRLYYEHMNQTFDEARETFDFTKGEDKYYNNGFWEGGYKGRTLVSQAHQDTKDKFNKQLQVMQEQTNIASIASSGDSQNAFNALVEGIKTGGLITPKDMYDGAKAIAESLANSPDAFDKDGNFRLESIKDKKIPVLNKTFGEVLGNTQFELYKQKAYKFKAENNYKDYSNLAFTAEQYVVKGDPNTLTQMLESELERTKGVKTPVTNMFEEARERALHQQRRMLNGEANAIIDIQKTQEALKYIETALGGKYTPNKSNTTIENKYFDRAFYEQLNRYQDHTEKLRFALRVADCGERLPFNPAKSYLAERFSEAFSVLDNDIIAYQSDPTKFNATWNPKIETLAIAYGEDSSGTASLIKGVDVAKAQVLTRLYRAGVSYKDIVAGMVKYKELNSSTEGKKTIKTLESKILNTIGSENKSSNNGYRFTVLNNLALAQIAMNPTMGASTAVEQAKSMFEENHTEFRGTYIPNSFFKFPDDANDSEVFSAGQETLGMMLDSLTIPKDAIISYIPDVDDRGQCILVYNPASAERYGVISKSQLNKWWKDNKEKYKQELLSKQERQVRTQDFLVNQVPKITSTIEGEN